MIPGLKVYTNNFSKNVKKILNFQKRLLFDFIKNNVVKYIVSKVFVQETIMITNKYYK